MGSLSFLGPMACLQPVMAHSCHNEEKEEPVKEVPRLAAQIAARSRQRRGHRGGRSELIEVSGTPWMQQLLRRSGAGREIKPGVWRITMEELAAVFGNPGMDRPD